jgi:proteic killer suppression protein
MIIGYKTRKLEKSLNIEKEMVRTYGTRRAKLLQTRLARLRAARSLMDFAPPYSGSARCHELKGDKAGIFSIDLDHPYRLLFRPDHDPLPQRSEGGIDWSQVIAIVILEIEDTHE